MLRAGINDPKSPVILVGLVAENVARLKAGYPIKAELKTFGVDLPGHLAIVYGDTHASLEHLLREHGLVNPGASRTIDPRLEEQESIQTASPNVLVCTVGLPRSGKTTWAKSQAYPIVNPDSIRLALHGQRFVSQAEPWVWAMAKTMVRSLFLAGHSTVILDATNMTKKRREDWLSKEWGTFFKVIETSQEECERRAVGDPEILPVIQRMAAEIEKLDATERKWP